MTQESGPSIAELLRMGEMGLELGYWQQAEEYFDAVLEQAPGHPAALLGKARACRNPKRALDLVRLALRDRPSNREALLLEADLLAQLQALESEPLPAPQPVTSASDQSVQRTMQWTKRAWPLLALALALVLGGGALGLWRGRQSARAPSTASVRNGDVAASGPLAAPTTTSSVAMGDAPAAMALLLVVDRQLSYLSQGSSSIITQNGLLLTNYHVVANAERSALANPDGLALVGLTRDAREAPSDWYIGVVVAQDTTRDLAVLRLLYTADGRAIRGRSFATLPLGDSDTLVLGQTLIGLGYPAIGGNTLTLVRGSMAGFASDENGVRYGKTDSELAPGSSGGAVLDESGLLVGVMTRVTRDDETQGRLGYFVLLNDARALISEAQKTPSPHPEIDWLVAFFRQQVSTGE